MESKPFYTSPLSARTDKCLTYELFAKPFGLSQGRLSSLAWATTYERSLATPRNYDIPTSSVTGWRSSSELRGHIFIIERFKNTSSAGTGRLKLAFIVFRTVFFSLFSIFPFKLCSSFSTPSTNFCYMLFNGCVFTSC